MQAQKIVEKSLCKQTIFDIGTIATVKIPKKRRLTSERSRLPVRILQHCPHKSYVLICQVGQLHLQRIFQHSELNALHGDMATLLGTDIATTMGDKTKVSRYQKAVQLLNGRGTVNTVG